MIEKCDLFKKVTLKDNIMKAVYLLQILLKYFFNWIISPFFIYLEESLFRKFVALSGIFWRDITNINVFFGIKFLVTKKLLRVSFFSL